VFSVKDGLAGLSMLSLHEERAFVAFGILTIGDVLDHFPKRYEDRRCFDAFPTFPSVSAVCLRGSVIDAGMKRFGGGRQVYEAVILDGTGGIFGSGKITCRWFNMPYIQKTIAVGQKVSIYGKVKDYNGILLIDHPEFEVLGEDEDQFSIHLERIVPIYRKIPGIPQRRLRECVDLLLRRADPTTFVSVHPGDADGASRADAYRQVHFPSSMEEAELARRRFAFEEFFVLQLNVVWRRMRHLENSGRVLGTRTMLLKQFYNGLPFDLTGAQKRAIKEILSDMRTTRPMNRLLQGDVGSGKTFVAMAAMLLAIGTGCQAALMAPTQILAEQHYLTFMKWLGPIGVKIHLKTGNRNEGNGSGADQAQIVVGTHALLYDRLLFRDLGLVVIDEQHKFGVSQRATLIRQGLMPDVLVMTATPIPRTLMMTIYGDLDVSILDEKPPGRARVRTALRVSPKQTDVTKFVKDQLGQGRQAYLVYPLVEESESLKIESATEAFAKWQKRLKSYRVDLIHGKLRPEEKEEVMRRFREGETAALVSTTVIEVGVDVPNASVMILHHAERFGLSQLHQLRGRIGRGGHKGYCILLTDGKSEQGMEKLRVLEQTADGFEIAEADLQLRGPGDALGAAQSGVSDLRFVDFLGDTLLLGQARELADRVIHEDPCLDGLHHGLRAMIQDSAQVTDLSNTA
jgi:ATP-dependent DNA helicase RecG